MHAIRLEGNIHQSTADNGTCNAFKTVVAQYACFSCVLGLADCRHLYKTGELNRLVTDLEAMKTFIQYFQGCSRPNTTKMKCQHLRYLAERAAVFFTSGDANATALKRKALNCEEFSGRTSNWEKKEGRREARQKKTGKRRA